MHRKGDSDQPSREWQVIDVASPPAGWPATLSAFALTAPAIWSVRAVVLAFNAPTPLAAVGLSTAAVPISAAAVAPDPQTLLVSTSLGWTLCALAFVDVRVRRLPDLLTLPLLLAGLAHAAFGAHDALLNRAIGAMVGYFVFAAAAWSYRRLRGREGLGPGDAKLLAAAGAWLGWAPLPWVVMTSAGLGLAWAALVKARGGEMHGASILPFGPFLVGGVWLSWLWLLAHFPR